MLDWPCVRGTTGRKAACVIPRLRRTTYSQREVIFDVEPLKAVYIVVGHVVIGHVGMWKMRKEGVSGGSLLGFVSSADG